MGVSLWLGPLLVALFLFGAAQSPVLAQEAAPETPVPDPSEPEAPVVDHTGAASGDAEADGAVVAASVVVTLDQERLFTESAFGQASLAREREAATVLEEENSRIEAELVAEEQDLTTRRATLPPEEFTALAAAFDEKVERIRGEQDAKVRDLGRARDEDRQAFLRAVVPVLGELLRDKGAVAILDKSSVILSLTAIDVTDEAIARVNAVLPTKP